MKELGFDIGEDDLIMLESLVKSPAFAALVRTVERYKKECFSKLLTEKSPPQMFELQGRVIGSTTFINLPTILVHQRQLKLKSQQSKQDIEKSTGYKQA